MRIRKYTLYVLRDPVTLDERYVGVTTDPKKRERSHSTTPQKSEAARIREWKTRLAAAGRRPIFQVIKVFSTPMEAFDAEVKKIKELRTLALNSAHTGRKSWGGSPQLSKINTPQ